MTRVWGLGLGRSYEVLIGQTRQTGQLLAAAGAKWPVGRARPGSAGGYLR